MRPGRWPVAGPLLLVRSGDTLEIVLQDRNPLHFTESACATIGDKMNPVTYSGQAVFS